MPDMATCTIEPPILSIARGAGLAVWTGVHWESDTSWDKLFVVAGSHYVIDCCNSKSEIGATMANSKAIEEVILVIGTRGSDAGYSVLTPHGLRRVPGNNPEAREAFATLTKSFAKLQEISLKEHVGGQ